MAKHTTGRRRTGLGISLLVLTGGALAGTGGLADARPLVNPGALGRDGVVLVGHDVNVVPAVRRFAVVVTAVGAPDAKGNVYTFGTSLEQNPLMGARQEKKEAFALNEVRSWRITVVSGERLGAVFQVEANTAAEIKVTDAFGPLNGLAVGDFMLIEEIFIRAPTPVM